MYRKPLKTEEIYVQGSKDQLFDLTMLSTRESHSTLTEHPTVVR